MARLRNPDDTPSDPVPVPLTPGPTPVREPKESIDVTQLGRDDLVAILQVAEGRDGTPKWARRGGPIDVTWNNLTETEGVPVSDLKDLHAVEQVLYVHGAWRYPDDSELRVMIGSGVIRLHDAKTGTLARHRLEAVSDYVKTHDLERPKYVYDGRRAAWMLGAEMVLLVLGFLGLFFWGWGYAGAALYIGAFILMGWQYARTKALRRAAEYPDPWLARSGPVQVSPWYERPLILDRIGVAMAVGSLLVGLVSLAIQLLGG